MTKTYHIPTAPTSPIRKPRPHLDLRDFGITLRAGALAAGARPCYSHSGKPTGTIPRGSPSFTDSPVTGEDEEEGAPGEPGP